jgi:hypothetical protein
MSAVLCSAAPDWFALRINYIIVAIIIIIIAFIILLLNRTVAIIIIIAIIIFIGISYRICPSASCVCVIFVWLNGNAGRRCILGPCQDGGRIRLRCTAFYYRAS